MLPKLVGSGGVELVGGRAQHLAIRKQIDIYVTRDWPATGRTTAGTEAHDTSCFGWPAGGRCGRSCRRNVEPQGWRRLETSDAEGFWKAAACTREHPQRSPCSSRPPGKASALLLDAIGSDLLDYKKRR